MKFVQASLQVTRFLCSRYRVKCITFSQSDPFSRYFCSNIRAGERQITIKPGKIFFKPTPVCGIKSDCFQVQAFSCVYKEIAQCPPCYGHFTLDRCKILILLL